MNPTNKDVADKKAFFIPTPSITEKHQMRDTKEGRLTLTYKISYNFLVTAEY
jgi:hypothetical protein